LSGTGRKHPLLAFYAGEAPDHRGRYLADIVRRDDRWLEATHDYIQWLFPLREPSGVLPSAPLIDAEVAAAFATDERLRSALHASFVRMLAFYGLREAQRQIVKGENWDERKIDWFTRPTHNDLRITRILKCLGALGCGDDAQRLLAALVSLAQSERDFGVSAVSVAYWRDAVRG
jgi:hypothetical protein